MRLIHDDILEHSGVKGLKAVYVDLLILRAVHEIHHYEQPIGVTPSVFLGFFFFGEDDFLQPIKGHGRIAVGGMADPPPRIVVLTGIQVDAGQLRSVPEDTLAQLPGLFKIDAGRELRNFRCGPFGSRIGTCLSNVNHNSNLPSCVPLV